MLKIKLLITIILSMILSTCHLAGDLETVRSELILSFTGKPYTVVFNANGGWGDMENVVLKYGVEQALPANTFARTGYIFSGWSKSAFGSMLYKDEQSTINVSIKPNETVLLYAIWEDNFVDVQGTTLTEKLTWLQSNAKSNTAYMLDLHNDESINPTTLSYSGRNNIAIIMRGTDGMRTVNLSSNGSMFTVQSGISLILENNITLKGRSNNNNSLIRVNTNGYLIITGGNISGNIINFDSNNSSFISATGGGVYVAGGHLIMSGGSIIDNSASFSSSYREDTRSAIGGGVYVAAGYLIISGGNISGNNASAITSASGINSSYIARASATGGGVYVENGHLIMSGGNINGNTASASTSINNDYTYAIATGGGVSISEKGIINKTGGIIFGYTNKDSKSNSVLIKRGDDSTFTVPNNGSHAVLSGTRRKERTAGHNVNLFYDGSGSSPISSGDWDN